MTVQMSRRRFLGLVTAIAGATGLPAATVARALQPGPADIAAAAELTTLVGTLRAGSAGTLGYRPVVSGPGEPHLVRDDLVAAQAGRAARRVSLVHLLHLTDQHIIDVQSPSRVEFFDRYNDERCSSLVFSAAFRPQEAANARIADAMIRRARRIARSPVTGAPIAAAVCTGDNTDNQQANELTVFLGVMDGGRVTPQSGAPDRYEGVQASGDTNYWHPSEAVADLYKTRFGFPARPGFLEEALAPFDAVGLGVPWFSCYGNHDGLVQGNFPANDPMERQSTGPVKPVGLPPGSNPCSEFGGAAVPGAPLLAVTADAERRFLSRREWMQAHLDSPGLPRGHGFSDASVRDDVAYYAADVGGLRWLVLDTVNPGGESSGSIGDRQLAGLEAELTKAQDERRLVLLFSHHGLRSLDNTFRNPDPANPSGSDLPRHQAGAVEAVVRRFPAVIAWINGHSHRNVVIPRGSFWDIGTAAHIDWPAQSRLVEVVDNRDGTLSLFTTMFDHEDDPLVAFARELSGNDPQSGFADGTGTAEDRNLELLIPHPFAPAGASPSPTPSATASPTPASPSPGTSPPAALPTTGGPATLTIGGALLATAWALRTRGAGG